MFYIDRNQFLQGSPVQIATIQTIPVTVEKCGLTYPQGRGT